MPGSMLYRKLPSSGESISILGFGCMRFPRVGVTVDEGRVERLVASAIDCGINIFDTAYGYSGSEKALGRILTRLRKRSNVLISTKFPLTLIKRRGDIEGIFSKQLERLQTEYVDFYLAQNMNSFADFESLIEKGFEDFIIRERGSGRIRHVGLSFHGNLYDFKRIIDAYPWEFCMLQYNYFDENFQAGSEGIKYAASKGVAVTVMEPLRGGLLGDGLSNAALKLFTERVSTHASAASPVAPRTPGSPIASSVPRAQTAPIAQGSQGSPIASRAPGSPIASRAQGSQGSSIASRAQGSSVAPRTARRPGAPVSPVDVALRWVWSNPDITCAFSGMNEERHVEENCCVVLSIAEAIGSQRTATGGAAGQKRPDAAAMSAGDSISAAATQKQPHAAAASAGDSISAAATSAGDSISASATQKQPDAAATQKRPDAAAASAGDSISAAATLTDDEMSAVEAVREYYNANLRIPCTACSYCMPCPYGVDIVTCFFWYNMNGMQRGLSARYHYVMATEGETNNKPSKASQCHLCGACERICPQKIEVRKQLKNVAYEMEKFWFNFPVKTLYRYFTNS